MRPIFAAFLAAALSCGLAGAQPLSPAHPPAAAAPPLPSVTAAALTRSDIEAFSDGFIPNGIDSADIAGAVVVVVKDGQVLFEKGYGVSDVASRTPVDPDRTLFRPGSVSKLFTWTAVMQLVAAGKLDLDKDVDAYLDFTIPEAFGKPVTLRALMTHTAGFEEVLRPLLLGSAKGITPL